MQEGDKGNKHLGIDVIHIKDTFTKEEEDKIKDILFSFNEVKQIYFGEKVDYETIEKLKYYLEISSYIDDSKVEKIVFAKLNEVETNRFINIKLINPTTWTIAYDQTKNTVYTTDFPRYRAFKTYLRRIKIVLDQLEEKDKVRVLVEELKSFKKIKDSKTLIEVLEKREISAGNYEMVLHKLLKDNNISSYIAKTNGGRVLVIRLKDDIYVFSQREEELIAIKDFSEGFLSPFKFLYQKEFNKAMAYYALYITENDDDMTKSLGLDFKVLYELVNNSKR